MVMSFRIFADGCPQAAAARGPVLHQHRMCVFFRVIDGVLAMLPPFCFRGTACIRRIKRVGAGITAFFDFVQITSSFSSLFPRHRSISFWHWCISKPPICAFRSGRCIFFASQRYACVRLMPRSVQYASKT